MDLLFANDSELVALSAYILELIASYYSISMCMSVQAHVMMSTDMVTSAVSEVISSMAEFANTIASMYIAKNPEELSANPLRVQLILMLILRLVLSTGTRHEQHLHVLRRLRMCLVRTLTLSSPFSSSLWTAMNCREASWVLLYTQASSSLPSGRKKAMSLSATRLKGF